MNGRNSTLGVITVMITLVTHATHILYLNLGQSS